MKKKITAFLMLMIAVLALSACSGGGAATPTAPAVPTQLTVSGDTLSWAASEGAESYTLSVNGSEVQGIMTTSVDLKSQAVAAHINEGANTLKVKAVKGQLASAYSAAVTYTLTIPDEKLAAPVISISATQHNRIEWSAVANASGYKINIDGADMAGKLTACYYDMLLNVASAQIKVKAVGAGHYLDSDYSNTLQYENAAPETAKLATPTLTVNKKTITWEDVDFASSYKVSVNDSEFVAATSPYTLSETAEGSYAIKVKAIGDGVLYADSDAAETSIVIAKLLTPTLSVTKRTVCWQAVADAVKYQVKINDGAYTDSASPFVLPDSLSAGSYVVSVKAIGNGETTLDSAAADSAAIVIVKLDKPTALAYTGNRLTWTGTASKYKVAVTKDGGAEQIFETTVAYKDFSYSEAGVYAFTVTACSSDTLELDSDASDKFEKTITQKIKLATPVNASFSGNVLLWDSVAQASGYAIEIKKDGTLLRTETVTAATYTFSDTDIGVYSFRVKATTTDTENFTDSDFTAAITKTVSGKLTAPVISIDTDVKNKIVWEAVANAQSYEIYINGTKQPTAVTGLSYTVTVAVGTFTVKIKAVSSSSLFSASDFSNEASVVITKLAITAVTVTGRTVSFTAPNNAVRVEYQINGGAWTATTDSFVTVDAAVGEYTVKIRAIGDGQITLSSDEVQKAVTVSKLSAPVLSIDAADKRKVVWQAMENASFKISLDNIEFVANNQFNYIFNKTEAGTYTLYVKAEGTATNYLDSDTVSKNVVFTKLAAPTALTYNEVTGVLTWTGSGAKYVITIDLDGAITTEESTVNSFNPGFSAAGTYIVTVTAKGADTVTLDSDASQSLSVTVTVETPKLGTPVVTLTDKTLSWAKVDFAQSYTIELLGKNNYTFTVAADGSESYAYLIGTVPINAGQYTVKVCAETTSADYVKSEYWTSNYTESVALGKTVILVSGKTVSWTSVSNAVSYKLYKQESGGEKTLLADNITGLSYTFESMTAPFIGKLFVTAVGDGVVYLDSETEKADVTISVKLAAPVVTRDDDNRKFTIATVVGVKDIMYTYTAKGAAEGAAVKYTAPIAYGDTAGEYILSVYFTGLTGYDTSDKTTATYTVLGKLENIIISKDKISFDAVDGVEKYVIKDNGSAWKDFAVDEALTGGMHRFYISAASNDAHTLPGLPRYYTVLVISTAAEFNLIVNSYENDALGNGANNLWGTSTLIADIPDASTLIKKVSATKDGKTVDYNGYFLGNGYSIGKTVPLSGSEGLFGTNRGHIENLTLYVNSDTTATTVGGIAKSNLFRVTGGVVVKGEIKNVKVYGVVKGATEVGGIVGVNAGDIEDCFNYAAVTGTGDKIGGIVGDNKEMTVDTKTNSGYMKKCVNYGAVTGANNVGGIVGTLSKNAVDGGFNKGNVLATGWGVGGIAGYTLEGVKVFDSMNAGEVGLANQGYNVGGIIGKHGLDFSGYKNAALHNSINVGKVNNGNGNAGGLLVGQSYVWKLISDGATDRWGIQGGILNCAYLESTAGATADVGDNKNAGGAPSSGMKKMSLSMSQADATTLCNELNTNDYRSDGDVFKVLPRADSGSYYVIVAWCESYL